jgi:hypothetical protein
MTGNKVGGLEHKAHCCIAAVQTNNRICGVAASHGPTHLHAMQQHQQLPAWPSWWALAPRQRAAQGC